MGTRRLWLVLAFLLLLPGEVMAHRHRAGVFYIPSRLRHSDFTSWVGVSGALPIKYRAFSAIGAFSRYSGTDDGEDFTLFAYTAGVSYTFKNDCLSPYVQLLGGGVHAVQKIDNTDTTKHRTHGIAALGGGINIKVWGHQGYQLRLRGQIDGVRFKGKTGVAFSVGLGLQFPYFKECPKEPCP